MGNGYTFPGHLEDPGGSELSGAATITACTTPPPGLSAPVSHSAPFWIKLGQLSAGPAFEEEPNHPKIIESEGRGAL